MPSDHRCKGCGEVLDAKSEDVVQINEGAFEATKTKRLRFVMDDEWGAMHKRCFLIAIGDPSAIDVLDESA
jgi:hypothetical protein